MGGLRLTVRAFCIVAFITGAFDLVNGIGLLMAAGAPLENLRHDPVLNSQVRFWGAIWFGFGLILWRSSTTMISEPGLFKLLCGIIGLSGAARLVSALIYGLPGAVLTGAMVLELSACTGLLLWHALLLRQRAPG